MKHSIIPVGRRAITAAFAACLAIPTLSAQAPISGADQRFIRLNVTSLNP